MGEGLWATLLLGKKTLPILQRHLLSQGPWGGLVIGTLSLLEGSLLPLARRNLGTGLGTLWEGSP